MAKDKIYTVSSLFLLIIISVLFYYINATYGYRLDDSAYSRVWADGLTFPKDTEAPHIETFSDVLASQYHHYMGWNGRTITHVLVQGFCGLWGKSTYNIVATLSFILLLFLIGRIGLSNYKNLEMTLVSMLVSAGLLFFAMPTPVDMVDGMAWGCNYLLTPTIVLMFYWVITQMRLSHWWTQLVFVLFSFLAGWTHESAVLPLCGALLLYVWNNRKKLQIYEWFAIGLFCLGGLLMVICPGNFVRFKDLEGELSFSDAIGRRMMVIKSMWCVYILLILLWMFGYRSWKKMWFFFKANYIESVAMFLAILFVLMVGALAPRFDFFINLFALLLICRLLQEKGNVCNWIGRISGLVLVLFLPFVYYYSVKAADQYGRIDAMMAPQHDNKEGFVLVSKCDIPWGMERFVDVFSNTTGWAPIWFQHKYNKEDVIALVSKSGRETAKFADCFEMEEFKMKGDNPFYQIGFYCYSKDPLPPSMNIRIHFGVYNLKTIEGIARKLYSLNNGPLTELETVVVTERIEFRGEAYSKFYLHPNNAIPIVSVDYLK